MKYGVVATALLVAINPTLAANQTMLCTINTGAGLGRDYVVEFNSRTRSLVVDGSTHYPVTAVDNSRGRLIVFGTTVANGPKFQAHLLPDKKIEYFSNGKLEQVDPCHALAGASVASAQGAAPGGNATGLVGNKSETITILGNTYKIRPDINEDVIWKWSLLEPYLPKELFVKPAKKWSDQQVLDFIGKLDQKDIALLNENMKAVVARHTAEVLKDHPDASPMDVQFFINDEAFTVNAGGAIGEQPTQDIYNRKMAEFRLMDYLKASINKTMPDMIVH
jgi:hypothetical protein